MSAQQHQGEPFEPTHNVTQHNLAQHTTLGCRNRAYVVSSPSVQGPRQQLAFKVRAFVGQMHTFVKLAAILLAWGEHRIHYISRSLVG